MKKSFLIYQDWEEIFDSLTDAQVGKLLKSMLDHARGEEVSLPPKLSLLFISFRQQMDRNLQNYEKVSEVRRQSANKRWNQVQEDTNTMQKMQLHAKAYDKDKVKDKYIKKGNKTKKTPSSYKKNGNTSNLNDTHAEDNQQTVIYPKAGLTSTELEEKLWIWAERISEKGAKKNV